MNPSHLLLTRLLLCLFFNATVYSQIESNKYKLVWSDEFNQDGQPDSTKWSYENGFVRNNELQWYQPSNAYCADGYLIIEGRRETVKNANYQPNSDDWRKNREYAGYTSACLITKDKHQWKYGRFEIRARIDTTMGSWPAIWTLGVEGRWPNNGEVDIMEFYRIDNKPHILANFAWSQPGSWKPTWDAMKLPSPEYISIGEVWADAFHVWAMEWDSAKMSIYCDGILLNDIDLSQVQVEGQHPFRQPHYLLLNLAIGSNGGDPSHSSFPIQYEIDYVRVYKPKGEAY